MDSKTLGSSKLGLLMACASPGSALAYHLGLTRNETDLMHRTSSSMDDVARAAARSNPSAAAPADAAPRLSVSGWLADLFGRVARWWTAREAAEIERYLAQAKSVADVEARMRDLHSGRYWLL